MSFSLPTFLQQFRYLRLASTEENSAIEVSVHTRGFLRSKRIPVACALAIVALLMVLPFPHPQQGPFDRFRSSQAVFPPAMT